MNVGIFLPNWLGDVVMATPTLRALRKHFGAEAHLVGIMRPYLAELLQGTGWLDEQWFYHKRAKDPRQRPRALIRRMRRQGFDLVVLLPNSFSTAWIAWRAKARKRIGYVRYGRGPLLTGKVYPKGDRPMVDYYLELARAVGCAEESRQLELAVTDDDQHTADQVWDDLNLPADGRVITFNCSGAYGAAKLWPVEHFAELAGRIVDRMDHDVLVMCGPAEREIARDIVRLAGHRRVVSMADQPLGIGTAKACMGRSRLMVSTDSGPRHVAAAMGRPVVTMFGPMLPVWSENPTVRAANLVLDLDCIGCHKRACPLGHHRCMRDLSVDRVFGEVQRVASGAVDHEVAGAKSRAV